MTLVQLDYIIAVDTYRSFVAAAEKCFVTQPTLSMQIQKLEDSLGVKIFDRTRQPVVPTEIGKKIIAQARTIIIESKKITELLQLEKGELSGDLKIGVIPTVAPYLLPAVISNFMKKYPKLRLQIWEHTTEQITHGLKQGTLDCGILSTPIYETAVQETPLFYETFVAYVSKRSPVFDKKLIQTDDISNEKLWLLNEGHCMRGQVLNICNFSHNQSKEGSFEYNTGSVETLKRMVDLNGGLTILPELSIANYDEDQLSHVRYFRNPEPVREISLVTPQNYVKKQAIDALQSEILSMVPDKFKSKRKKEVMGFALRSL
ncbi:MAG TPA: LysR family transcriptional regulator [Candidatus Sphingobacterium stercorigallinarum]|nr:LysR family transcriptional regulator [Candidatus Sphingobacterium stercorigallinarum]